MNNFNECRCVFCGRDYIRASGSPIPSHVDPRVEPPQQCPLTGMTFPEAWELVRTLRAFGLRSIRSP